MAIVGWCGVFYCSISRGAPHMWGSLAYPPAGTVCRMLQPFAMHGGSSRYAAMLVLIGGSWWVVITGMPRKKGRKNMKNMPLVGQMSAIIKNVQHLYHSCSGRVWDLQTA